MTAHPYRATIIPPPPRPPSLLRRAVNAVRRAWYRWRTRGRARPATPRRPTPYELALRGDFVGALLLEMLNDQNGRRTTLASPTPKPGKGRSAPR